MRSLWTFVRSVARHWGSLVTGGFVIGLIGIWQGTGHAVRPGVYWAVALLALFAAFFAAWSEEHKAKERVAAEHLAAAKVTAAAVTSSDWRELADRFSKLSRHVHVGWTQWGGDSGRQFWSLGGSTPEETHQCRALCELAGAMLVRSPNVCREFRDLHEPDAADRWLCFLKYTGALQSNGYGVETLDDGTRRPIFLGMISNLAGVSATACLTCSANAL